MTLVLQLLLKFLKGMLLSDSQIAKAARKRFIIGIRDALWHRTGACGLRWEGGGRHGKWNENEK